MEVWRQFGPESKWRVEKPGRVAVMDGQSSLLLQKGARIATRDKASANAFDTEWLQRLGDLGGTLDREIGHAKALGWKASLVQEAGSGGRAQSVVTIRAKAGVPEDDYLRNHSLDLSDTRRVYRFDAATGRLEGAQVYLEQKGAEVLILELTQIECDQPLAAGLFRLELPQDVAWSQEPQPGAELGPDTAAGGDDAAPDSAAEDGGGGAGIA